MISLLIYGLIWLSCRSIPTHQQLYYHNFQSSMNQQYHKNQFHPHSRKHHYLNFEAADHQIKIFHNFTTCHECHPITTELWTLLVKIGGLSSSCECVIFPKSVAQKEVQKQWLWANIQVMLLKWYESYFIKVEIVKLFAFKITNLTSQKTKMLDKPEILEQKNRRTISNKGAYITQLHR